MTDFEVTIRSRDEQEPRGPVMSCSPPPPTVPSLRAPFAPMAQQDEQEDARQ